MQRLEVTVSDELADALRPYRDRIDQILRLGLQQLEAGKQRPPSDANGPVATRSTRLGTGTDSEDRALPPLVVQLDALRGSLAQGRTFEDSADVIREERASRTTIG